MPPEPPVALPPVELPPVALPPVELPPVALPPVELPPVALPPVELPPVDEPPLPPVELPPVELPPVDEPPLPPLSSPLSSPSSELHDGKIESVRSAETTCSDIHIDFFMGILSVPQFLGSPETAHFREDFRSGPK